jgi:arylsulfatase A-like enzyme
MHTGIHNLQTAVALMLACLQLIESATPNVFVIIADDVGTGDIPFWWNVSSSLVDMPNIKMLADKGVSFRDAHSTPLCAPSRYMLLSGNYQHRGEKAAGTWNINGNSNQFQPFQKSIAEALQDGASINTAIIGKWHIGGKIPLAVDGTLDKKYKLTSPGHDWSRPLIGGPQDIGFNYSMITPAGIQNAPYVFFRDGFPEVDVSDAVFWKRGYYNKAGGTSQIERPGEGDPDWDSTTYNQILVNETAAFLDNHMLTRPDDPFFVYAALGAVHVPHTPPDNYLDGTPVKGSQNGSLHMDMLFEMDLAVGSMVSMIEDRGLLNETIIIFASDNGGAKTKASKEFGHDSHGPLRGAKGSVYEGGHRVPMIFRYDGHFPVNETRNALVGLNDLYATICALTGVAVPDKSAQDSVSFAHHIYDGNDTANLRTWLATWSYPRGLLTSLAIRKNNLKFVQHLAPNRTSEIYDLDVDIGETNNLVFTFAKKERNKLWRKLIKEGPCPRDRKKSMLVNGTRVDCDFFREDKRRCREYSEGEKNCNSVCGRHKTTCDKSFG